MPVLAQPTIDDRLPAAAAVTAELSIGGTNNLCFLACTTEAARR